MSAVLDYTGDEMFHLDVGFWVDVKRFTIDEHASDEDLLRTLIAHPNFADHYAGQTVEDQHADGLHGLHGPYNLAQISPETYVEIEAAEAVGIVEAWVKELLPLPDGAEAAIRNQIVPLLQNVAYRLPDIRATAEHEWGWVVGRDGFHEFVIIDRPNTTLSLVVASDD